MKQEKNDIYLKNYYYSKRCPICGYGDFTNEKDDDDEPMLICKKCCFKGYVYEFEE